MSYRDTSVNGAGAIPAHIPPGLVHDFDPYAVAAEEDPHIVWKRVQDSAPRIFWSPQAGHWIVTRAEDIKAIQLDHERFSHSILGRGLPGGLKPLSSDPPEHGRLRAMLMPAFLPRAIKILEDRARELAISLIEAMKPRGECEFVEDFARILPMEVFLKMVGLPSSDRSMLTAWVEGAIHGARIDPPFGDRCLNNLRQYIEKTLEIRRTVPGDDVLSVIVLHESDGQRFTQEECMSMATLLLLGGLDTVASMIGFICRSLAMNPTLRHRIRDEPLLRPRAIEELLRRHGLSNTMRIVTQDTVFAGVTLKKGDPIQQAATCYGLDDSVVSHPMEIDLDREAPIPHAAFGNGPHTCPGQMLARREIKVFLEEWLERIPDFQIKPGTRPQMRFLGLLAMKKLELCWDPNQ
jgi:cytochrome P450